MRATLARAFVSGRAAFPAGVGAIQQLFPARLDPGAPQPHAGAR
ncbi:MAG: hypothetical protein R2867_25245 [Caldilineaceae bacterium]